MDAALLAILLIVTPLPKPAPTPNSCVTYLTMAGVQGMKITPQNVGKLYGSALALRIQLHKGTKLQNMFTQADLDAAARDIGACFLLIPETKK